MINNASTNNPKQNSKISINNIYELLKPFLNDYSNFSNSYFAISHTDNRLNI